jgi:hypothetical protein
LINGTRWGKITLEPNFRIEKVKEDTDLSSIEYDKVVEYVELENKN